MITKLIGRRRDETAASVLSTAARDGTSAHALEEKQRESFLFIRITAPYAAAGHCPLAATATGI